MDILPKKKILVIEDDVAHNDAYKQMLESEGFEVSFATTATQGLSLARAIKPKLILLDIMLPGGQNGFDILQTIRSDESLQKTPIIILTNLDATHEAEALSLGATKFFVKSGTSLEALLTEIKSLT